MKLALNSWLTEIQLSEARRRLSELLREIEADPDVGYRILRRNRVVAELRSPADRAGRTVSGASLLKAVGRRKRR